MFDLRAFPLEEFFRTYEHRPGLINLASSDAYPWSWQETIARCPELRTVLDGLSLGYPDLEEELLPNLVTFCDPPSGMRTLATSGTAEAIFLVLAGLRCQRATAPRIAVPQPSYGAFTGVSRLLGYDVVHYAYKRADDWSLATGQLRALCASCDVVVINNPHNPTGHLIDRVLLQDVSNEMGRKDGTLLVDEVFRLPEDFASAASLGQHIIVVGSLSKVYGMPGLRLGWVVANAARIDQLRPIQQYMTLSLSCFTTTVGAMILAHIERFSRNALLQNNRRIVDEWAAGNSRLLKVIHGPSGTTAILEIESPRSEGELFNTFLSEGVLLVPGVQCFEVEGPKAWFRLGYGTREDLLLQGLDAVATALRRS
jgi:aspartate/methionine/tyrosine aminotransferase